MNKYMFSLLILLAMGATPAFGSLWTKLNGLSAKKKFLLTGGAFSVAFIGYNEIVWRVAMVRIDAMKNYRAVDTNSSEKRSILWEIQRLEGVQNAHYRRALVSNCLLGPLSSFLHRRHNPQSKPMPEPYIKR